MPLQTAERPGAKEAAVMTKAAVNAADRLGLSARTLAAVIGVSEATVSRMKRQDLSLERGSKSFELAILLVRLAVRVEQRAVEIHGQQTRTPRRRGVHAARHLVTVS